MPDAMGITLPSGRPRHRASWNLDLLPCGTPPLLNDGRTMVPPGRVRHREALHVEDEGILINPHSLLRL